MAEQRVQRKLAAILAADIVGYSRMMGEDETGTLARLQALRKELLHPKVAEYGGRIVKTTGDGTLIEFPSAVDAVQHAVDVQKSIGPWNTDAPENQRILLRMGINVGDIIVEEDDIYGDGVNVAARLEALAEPGCVCISGTVFDQVKGKLDLLFDDLGPQVVKNIADPIRTYRIDVSRQVISSDGAASPEKDAEFLQRPALAVLPFENLGGDPDQAYFADGLTEDITTALSLWRSFPVIARNSTFVYRGEAVKIQEVGRELGARYVLEGSVRKVGDRIRVTAQLIDADTGHHVWAEKFDRQFEEIFDLQDELTQKIASIVAPELERAEDNRVKVNQPQNLDAWHLVQRGMALLDEYTKETNLRARNLFDQAIKLETTYSRAYSGLALAYARALMSGYEYSREEATDKCLEAARKAVASDSSDAYAHNMLGMAYLWARQNKEAVLSFQRAVELNPSYGHARASLGDTLNRIGRTDEGISLMEAALQLNPDAPNLRHINAFLARACINARRYEDAVEWARKAIHLRSDLAHAHCLMAAALGHLGRSNEARAALDECLRVQPDFFDSAADLSPYEDPASNEHLLEGLRRAGLAEPKLSAINSLQLPDKPSIAVLPFDNLSGDPEQEYFSDGLAEDLITDLSKVSGLFVVARNSAFAFKGQTIDVRRVAEKLGVHHVLEGSVRKAGGKVRINAQLIDAQTGGHIWAERYDGDLEDIFSLQDNITAQIVAALQVSLTPTDKKLTERKPTDNVDAYDLFLKGRAYVYDITPDNLREAMKHLEEAIEIDPKFGDAYGYLSFCHYIGWAQMWPGFEGGLDRAYELAERGVALDDGSATAFSRLGWMQTWLRRYEPAIANFEKALALSPNNAEVYALYGAILNYWGDPEKGLEMLEKAFSLDTFVSPVWQFQAGHSYLLMQQYDEAANIFLQTIERFPGFFGAYLYLACAYAELDRLDDARGAIKSTLEIVPQYTVQETARRLPWRSDEVRNRMLNNLRKAGLPEA